MATALPDKSYKKFISLLCLYIAQSVPLSFFTTVVPVIMRQENYSLESIGLLQLVKLPWILKFLWAPFIDKNTKSIKSYIRWIVYSELFYAMAIIAVGFLSLQTNFELIAALVIIAITASATQDIATDAFAILILHKSERGVGNGVQSAGSFLGSLIGSGVLLLIYHYFGWQALLFGLAAFVLLALIPLWFFKFKKAETETVDSAETKKKIRYSDICSFFTQKEISKQVLLLVLFYSGIIGILPMLKPFMVDLGYTIEQIGFMSGIVGTAVAAGCSFLGGWLVRRNGINRSAVLFSVLMIITASYFFVISNLPLINSLLLYIGIVLLWGTYGMAMVIVYTTSMNYVRKGCEGTDFTVQTVLAQLSSLVIAVLSGKISGMFQYKAWFAIEIVLAVISFLYISIVYTKKRTNA